MKKFLKKIGKNLIVIAIILGICLTIVSCGQKKTADVEVKIPENAFPSSSSDNPKKLEFDRR